MKKKLVCIVLVMIFVLSTAVFAFANDFGSYEYGINEQTEIDAVLEEMAALDAGTTLEELAEMGITLEELLEIDAEVDAVLGESYSVNERGARHQHSLIQEGFMTARDGSVIYPEFYGGSAIDYDGKLVVFIVESELEYAHNHDTIGSLLDAGLRYRYVEYSFEELLSITDEIASTSSRRNDEQQCIYSYNVTLVFPDIFLNRVVVYIVEYNNQMIEGFKRYISDSPAVVLQQSGRITMGGDSENTTFHYNDVDWNYNNNYWDNIYQQEGIIPFNTTLNTGSLVRRRYLTGGGDYATVGFRVRCARTGTSGFLTTAGTTFRTGNDVIERGVGGRQVGRVRSAMWLYGRSGQGVRGVNASFVEFTGSNQVSNTLPNGSNINPNLPVSMPIVGNWVNAYGGRSASFLSGNIMTNHARHIYSGRYMYQMTYLRSQTGTTASGNSGGPVLTSAGNPVGLISGGDPGGVTVLMVPLYRVLDVFRINNRYYLMRF